jgi:hypothetical protein
MEGRAKHLSDAPFLGRFLAFSANITRGLKKQKWTNTLAYSSFLTAQEKKDFITLIAKAKCYKTFLSVIYGFL